MATNEVVSRAPARICLFGDHQDYLELPIIACAFNRYIEIRGVPNADKMFHLKLKDLNVSRSIPIDELFEDLEKGDHIASTLKVLRRYHCIPTKGYTITVKGTIPINAGVSSSSAFVVAWVRFLLGCFGCPQKITNAFVAQLAYESEVVEHQSPGGKMDQYTIALGNIIYLETDVSNAIVKINKPIEGLILAESGIPKDTIGLLRHIKTNAQEAIRIVQNAHEGFELQETKVSQLEHYLPALPSELSPYFTAAIKNHNITQDAFQLLQKDKLPYAELGALMNKHHEVLKNQLKITTPKIDAMIDAALDAGAYGAKIVGSGGGGSICAIAPLKKQEKIIQAIKRVSQENAYAVEIVSD